MCINLNSITESPKVAESDMTTYKVLEVVEDEATGKESYYSPLSCNRLQYNVGEQYTESIGRTENVLGIEDGLETCICAKTTTGLYSFKDINSARVLYLMLMEILSDSKYTTFRIFPCKVPKGSKYYSASKGDEIVSDHLVILSQVN